jgi:hypothetical protein
MKRTKPTPRDEARGRFERHIATELAAKADVDTRTLAQDFYDKEEKLLRSIAAGMLLQMLVKWADDILGGSVGAELAAQGQSQLELPMGFEGIEVPGAISFVSGANRIKFVANYKVVGWQMESHAYLLRKRAQEVQASSMEFDRLWEAVKPLMDADPEMTLPRALKRLRGEAAA